MLNDVRAVYLGRIYSGVEGGRHCEEGQALGQCEGGSRAKKRGENALGLDDLERTLVKASIAATWSNKGDDPTMVVAGMRLIALIEEESQKMGLYHTKR